MTQLNIRGVISLTPFDTNSCKMTIARFTLRLKQIILLVPLIVSCTASPKQRVITMLDDVESYINERPDSALAVLCGMDSTSLTTRFVKAKHSLLHVMALDKCYMDITAPNLLTPAVTWYERHGSVDETMKVLYYQGRIAQENKDQNTAAVYFARAEEYAGQVTDKHALGVLYLAQASVYNTVHNLAKEKEYTEKGISLFQASNDSMLDIALGQLAITYLSLRDWAKADSLFQIGLAASSRNLNAQAVILSNYAQMKVLQPEPEPECAISLLDKKQKELGQGLSIQDAGAYAYALILLGRGKEAKEILIQIEKQATEYPIASEAWISQCALAIGDYELAYESLSRARFSEESKIHTILDDSVSDSISTYYEMSSKQKQMQSRINTAVMVIILLFLSIALVIVQIRKNRLDADRYRILGLCSDLEKEAAEQEIKSMDLQEQLNKLRTTARQERVLRFRQAGRLQSSIWRIDNLGPSWMKKDLEYMSVKKELMQVYDIEESGEKLTRRLDRELDGKILPLIEQLHLKDKPDEQLFLCCCLLDLPADMIAARFGWTSNNVRVRKCRLKNQISKMNNADYDALFNIRRLQHYE